MTIQKTITNLRGEHERVSLPGPHYTATATGQEDWTGVWVTALYSGPRTGRRFVETHSIWEDRRTNNIEGRSTRELDEDDYLDMCRRVGTEPVHVEAAEV